MSNPVFTTSAQTTFRFVAYRDFKLTLGKINAVVEAAELATRKFIQEAERSPNLNSYIQQLSGELGVRVDTLDLVKLRQLMAQFYIVSIHQQFEIFLDNFKKEHPDAKWKKKDEYGVLENVLRSLPESYDTNVRSVGRLEFQLAEFYRRVRNNFAHADTGEKLNADVEKLRSQVKAKGDRCSRLNAPNVYASISFDDFVLFSRTVKEIAVRLCIVARPTNASIVLMLDKLNENKHTSVDFTSLRGRHRDPRRQRNALETLLRSIYSLKKEESTPIIDLLLSGPLA